VYQGECQNKRNQKYGVLKVPVYQGGEKMCLSTENKHHCILTCAFQSRAGWSSSATDTSKEGHLQQAFTSNTAQRETFSTFMVGSVTTTKAGSSSELNPELFLS
jgi:hypothetical protein